MDIEPPPLEVLTVSPTMTGFEATLNGSMEVNTLDVSDVMLRGAKTGLVRGSVVVDESSRAFTFIKSAGPLVPDEYTMTLHSTADGFRTPDGWLLDGNRDGSTGDNLITSFAIEVPPAEAITVGIPDVIEGPGESFQIPVSLSQAAGVHSADLPISYDPALLEIISATVGDGLPSGSSVVLNVETPGSAILSFTSPADLPAGPVTFVDLLAQVPDTEQTRSAGEQHVLDVQSATIRDGLNNEIPVIDNDALHVVASLGDVSGDGRLTAADASLVARVAALLDTGFAMRRLSDPVLVADISGNGRINAFDASMIAWTAAGLGVAEINAENLLSSASVQTSQQVEDVLPSVQDDVPALILRDSQRMDWHRAAVDELMSSTLSGEPDREEYVDVLENRLDGLLVQWTSS